MRAVSLGYGAVGLEPDPGRDKVRSKDEHAMRASGMSEAAIEIYRKYAAINSREAEAGQKCLSGLTHEY